MEGEETEDCGGRAERYYMQGVQTIRGLRVQAAAFLNSNNQESVAEVNYCSDRATEPSREEGKRKADGARLIMDQPSVLRRIRRDGRSWRCMFVDFNMAESSRRRWRWSHFPTAGTLRIAKSKGWKKFGSFQSPLNTRLWFLLFLSNLRVHIPPLTLPLSVFPTASSPPPELPLLFFSYHLAFLSPAYRCCLSLFEHVAFFSSSPAVIDRLFHNLKWE